MNERIVWLLIIALITGLWIGSLNRVNRENYIFPKAQWGVQTNTAVLQFQPVANVNMYPKVAR